MVNCYPDLFNGGVTLYPCSKRVTCDPLIRRDPSGLSEFVMFGPIYPNKLQRVSLPFKTSLLTVAIGVFRFEEFHHFVVFIFAD